MLVGGVESQMRCKRADVRVGQLMDRIVNKALARGISYMGEIVKRWKANYYTFRYMTEHARGRANQAIIHAGISSEFRTRSTGRP